MKQEKKKRLDLLMVEKGLAQSRERARSLIMAGKVLVNTERVEKPGALFSERDDISLKGEDIPYVSRGGLKLAEALEAFRLNPAGFVCLDVGASTGGFTDCLLQHGAGKVFAIDVGYGQLAWKLRQDPRVVVIERANIRFIPPDFFPVSFDLITIDVSFISLKLVLPVVVRFMKPKGTILSLIKPQFEVGKGKVGKGGVVRDPDLHEAVLHDLGRFFPEVGLTPAAVIPLETLGPKGNREFMAYLRRQEPG